MPTESADGSRRLVRWCSECIHISWIVTTLGASPTFSEILLNGTPALAPRSVSSGSPGNWCEIDPCAAMARACSAAARASEGSRGTHPSPRAARSCVAAESSYCTARLLASAREVEDARDDLGELPDRHILACNDVDKRRLILDEQGTEALLVEVHQKAGRPRHIVGVKQLAPRRARTPHHDLLRSRSLSLRRL